jgi:hypothetical protein
VNTSDSAVSFPPLQPSPSAHILDVLNLFDNDKVNTAIGAMEAYADELFAAATPQVPPAVCCFSRWFPAAHSPSVPSAFRTLCGCILLQIAEFAHRLEVLLERDPCGLQTQRLPVFDLEIQLFLKLERAREVRRFELNPLRLFVKKCLVPVATGSCSEHSRGSKGGATDPQQASFRRYK